MKAMLFIFLIGTNSWMAFCQTPAETKAIKDQLWEIYDRDQASRKKGLPIDSIIHNDSINLAQIEQLIEKYGWLGKSKVGEHGNITLFLVIQHAELLVQEKYLPLLQQSVSEGESRPQDLALLQDRILMRQGKKQIYGSQIVFNKSTGNPEIYPIEDEGNVNIRRKEVGLQPLEKYAKEFGITYKMNVK